MLHLGDITKISGYDAPPVDVITGGSPCQDLSVAGKRAGLAGERSGLFMEQIRIIKEMRENDKSAGRVDDDIRPRYMVWENVPGAFSSNKGEDFRAVLEETAKVAERDASIPGPPGGKWPSAGCIMGNGWSIAWRVHDAQFWGVPQRRKRIALVADFGGETAPEILFEREGLPGNITESGKAGQDATTNVEAGVTEAGRAISFQERAGKPGGGKGILIQNERTGALSTLNNQRVCAFEPGAASRVGGHVYEDGVAGSLRANAGDNQQAIVYGVCSYDSNAMKSANPHSGVYVADTTRTLDNNGGNPACNQGGMIVLEGNGSRPSHKGDGYKESDTMYTLNSMEQHAQDVSVKKTVYDWHRQDTRMTECKDVCVTAAAGWGAGGNNMPYVLEEIEKPQTYQKTTGALMASGYDKLGTQVAKGPGAVCQSIVRRLTPLECERLQGYPDGWVDIGDWVDTKGKIHKDADSPKYKALGNSIALPFWRWMAERMVRYLGDKPTMASLFDGIGGFPLVFSRVGCKPVFSSEIEEYPIAVTKKHFGDDDLGTEGDYEQYLYV